VLPSIDLVESSLLEDFVFYVCQIVQLVNFLKPSSHSIICAEAHFLDSTMIPIHFKLLNFFLFLKGITVYEVFMSMSHMCL